MRFLLPATLLAVMAVPASAQTLLGSEAGSPYDPVKPPAIKKHDHIQIVVSESLKAISSADLRKDRRTRFEVALEKWLKIRKDSNNLPKLGSAALAEEPGIDLDARFRADNQGGTSRNFDLTFMITAEVIDVRPNGNLVIEAKKRRFVNSDEEVLMLTGEVSPKAIVNNVVKSERIANLDIRVVGEGPANSVTKPGFMTRFLDWLWPF
ncbi:MAG: flagellar basal body L-ring protein FlgH [Planctomycetota bacterium]|nr:flagellar basal body L-ring protein FlgH [Planctomycetota bacterium]